MGKTLRKRSRVCGDHFSKEDIVDTWVSGEGKNKYSVSYRINSIYSQKIINGEIIVHYCSSIKYFFFQICLKKPRLKPGAIPILNHVNYMNDHMDIVTIDELEKPLNIPAGINSFNLDISPVCIVKNT